MFNRMFAPGVPNVRASKFASKQPPQEGQKSGNASKKKVVKVQISTLSEIRIKIN